MADVDPLPKRQCTGPKKVLVLGGAGYVGQFIVKALSEAGYSVHVTHRPARSPKGLPDQVRLLPLDAAADISVAKAVLQEIGPLTAIVNCSAMAGLGPCQKDPEAAMTVNCPKPLLQAVSETAAKALFIHFSTDIVFDGDPDKIYEESSVTAPVNVYGRSKAEFDHLLDAQDKFSSVVLRPTNILGPLPPYPLASAGGKKFLQWLDERLQANEPSKLFCDEYRNYVWVDDLVDIVLKLINEFPKQLPTHSLMHCGGPEALNRVQVAEALAAAKGYSLKYMEEGQEKPRVISIPRASVDLGYPSPLCIRFRSSRVEEFLGRPMRQISTCIRAAAARI